LIDLSALYSNPYGYADICIQAIFTSPNGVQRTVDAFWMKDASINIPYDKCFHLRFTPDEQIIVHSTSLWEKTSRFQTRHNQFVVDDEWEDNPYNIAQGGPCTAPLSFFTDSTEKIIIHLPAQIPAKMNTYLLSHISVAVLTAFVIPFIVLFHEMGHAIPGMLFSRKPTIVFIGSYGNTKHAFKMRLGLLTIWLRYNPFKWSGGCSLIDEVNLTRGQKIVCVLGGPLFSVLMTLLICFIVFLLDMHGAIKLLCVFAAGYALVDLYKNLKPSSFITPEGKYLQSDGASLKFLLKGDAFHEQYTTAMLALQEEQYGDAASLLDQLINEGHQDERLYKLGISAYITAGHFDHALALHKQMAQHFAIGADEYINLGYIASKQKRHDEAMNYYKIALEFNSMNPGALNNIGYVLNKQQEYNRALWYFDSAIRLDPEFAFAFNNRGFAKIGLGAHEEGLSDIQRSMQLNDRNAYVYRNLGVYYLAVNDKEKALKLLLKAKNMDARTDDIDDYIQQAS
jgi:tetratricopeptide (TPR) repeat protein